MSDGGALAREIHLYSASIAAHATEEKRYWEILDRGERIRAERFRFERDRTNFVVAHGFLRTTLGRYVRRPPET
ncbi:MAG: 4'-phosphopantetheinyl transferase, partial [Candidatus Eremiobacteraeota bacterium]|nr:4'-phosphopantetheinyl transferase [Candidatus Eremiobacteraeota bacterium]